MKKSQGSKKKKSGGAPSKAPKSASKKKRIIKTGCSISISVSETITNASDKCSQELNISLAGPRPKTRGNASKKPIRQSSTTKSVAKNATEAVSSLAACAHPMRARILAKLLDGPTVYRDLQSLTKLKPGPLYHHVNQLRLAGLLRPKERDLYELTRGGRNLILIAAAANKLIHDSRRRPVEKVQ